MNKILIVGLLAFSLLLTGCLGDYSDGQRTGTLIKFSDKGFLWKTWEGELAMGSFVQTQQGASPYVFDFSVCDFDRNKINTLNNALNKQVVIHYHQQAIQFPWVGGSSSLFLGGYCVESITPVETGG